MKKENDYTHNLILETFVDFLLVIRELLDNHCLPIQSQRAILIEFFLLTKKHDQNQIL